MGPMMGVSVDYFKKLLSISWNATHLWISYKNKSWSFLSDCVDWFVQNEGHVAEDGEHNESSQETRETVDH